MVDDLCPARSSLPARRVEFPDARWRIGYSFWGFLTDGVVDTPDGGRSYRRPLIDALQQAGHRVVLVQANRDVTEAGVDLSE